VKIKTIQKATQKKKKDEPVFRIQSLTINGLPFCAVNSYRSIQLTSLMTCDTFRRVLLAHLQNNLPGHLKTISPHQRVRELGYRYTMTKRTTIKKQGNQITVHQKKEIGEPCTISNELNVDETKKLNLDQLISSQNSP